MQNEIWIIGYGYFGRRALQKLQEIMPNSFFVVIDTMLHHDEELKKSNVSFVKHDGIEFLTRFLSLNSKPQWIIPALSLHLAAEWCLQSFSSSVLQRGHIPEVIFQHLPNPILGQNGDLYISIADFYCPENCPEPAGYCFQTGETRSSALFEQLRKIYIPEYLVLVIRSHQLAPGVGGFRPKQILNMQEQIYTTPGYYLICTACRCHGVITALQYFY